MTDHGHSHNVPGHDAHAHGGDHDASHHIGLYFKVFVALCILTTMSFFTYSDYWPFHDTPSVGWAFMMCVSCCKALLVMLFFMHLKYEADWKYVLTIPASIMSVFLVLALVPDIGMRVKGSYGYGYSETRQQSVGTPTDAAALIDASMKQAAHDKSGGH